MTSRYPRLRGVDEMYLALESATTPMHLGALVVLDGGPLCDPAGRLRLADLRRHIGGRIAEIPELRRIVYHGGPLAGAPLWMEAPAFRVDRHVSEVRLPSPIGDETEALLRHIEPLLAPCLDRSQPLWRLWFLTGLPAGHVAALLVVHHALADGAGAMRLARSLLGAPLDGSSPVVPTSVERTEPPPWRDLVLDNARMSAAAAVRLTRPATWRAVAGVIGSFRAGWAAARDEPRTCLNAAVGLERQMALQRLDPVTVRRVARAQGGGANDVILALIAGGVRAVLLARGEAIDRLAPRAGVAVALPTAEHASDAGNHFGSYLIPLPIALSDPGDRLRRISIERAAAKETQSVTGVTSVRVWSARFAPVRSLMARQRVVQVMETYVPGPPRPIRLLGASVLDIIPIQPLGRNVGLTFLASSYAGRLTLAVRTDPDRFPDLESLVTAMDGDWRTLQGLATPEAARDSGRLPIPA